MSSEQSGSRKLPIWSIVLIVLLLGVAVFGDKGVLRALQLNRQKQDLQAEVDRLEQTKRELSREIEALRSDKRHIENIARQELGMVKENEVVYQFSEEESVEGESRRDRTAGE